jgi:PadR family transcriptional regulator PadR
MATDDAWPSDWLRGVLAVAVLAVLERGATHGYAIAAALSEAGLGTVKGGTLYPLLGRLETAGHLQAEWLPGEGGPGRKVYVLTAAGRRQLADQRDRWAEFTTLTTALISGSTTGVRP